jgi:hypothetical protein
MEKIPLLLKLHQFHSSRFAVSFFPGCCRFGEVRTLRARNWVTDRTKHIQAPTNDFCDPPKRPWVQFVVQGLFLLCASNCPCDFSFDFSYFFPGIFPRKRAKSRWWPPRPKDCILGSWSQWQLQGGCTGLKLRHREVEATLGDSVAQRISWRWVVNGYWGKVGFSCHQKKSNMMTVIFCSIPNRMETNWKNDLKLF